MKNIFLISSIIFSISCARANSDAANESAIEFSKNFKNSTSVSCTQTDSDNDGYCGCTVFTDSDPISIECGCERICIFNCARGCKVVEKVKFSR